MVTDLTSLAGILMGEMKRNQVVQSLYTNRSASSVEQNFYPLSYDKIAPAENSSAENYCFLYQIVFLLRQMQGMYALMVMLNIRCKGGCEEEISVITP